MSSELFLQQEKKALFLFCVSPDLLYKETLTLELGLAHCLWLS